MPNRALFTFLLCVLTLAVMLGTYQMLEHYVFPALGVVQQEVK